MSGSTHRVLENREVRKGRSGEDAIGPNEGRKVSRSTGEGCKKPWVSSRHNECIKIRMSREWARLLIFKKRVQGKGWKTYKLEMYQEKK